MGGFPTIGAIGSLRRRRTRLLVTSPMPCHGVQLVLSGHDHDYQRSRPRNGVTYVVSGGAAGSRRTGADAFTAVSFGWHHVVEVGAYPDRLVVRAVSPDLRVADEAAIALPVLPRR